MRKRAEYPLVDACKVVGIRLSADEEAAIETLRSSFIPLRYFEALLEELDTDRKLRLINRKRTKLEKALSDSDTNLSS